LFNRGVKYHLVDVLRRYCLEKEFDLWKAMVIRLVMSEDVMIKRGKLICGKKKM
jgi:hypothetical protein